MSKPVAVLMMLIVGVTAYILGAKAGKSRYREISQAAKQLWNEPSVRKTRERAGKAIDRAAAKAAARMG